MNVSGETANHMKPIYIEESYTSDSRSIEKPSKISKEPVKLTPRSKLPISVREIA